MQCIFSSRLKLILCNINQNVNNRFLWFCNCCTLNVNMKSVYYCFSEFTYHITRYMLFQLYLWNWTNIANLLFHVGMIHAMVYVLFQYSQWRTPCLGCRFQNFTKFHSFLVAMPCLFIHMSVYFYIYDMLISLMPRYDSHLPLLLLNCFMCSYAFALIENVIRFYSYADVCLGLCFLGPSGFLLVSNRGERTVSRWIHLGGDRWGCTHSLGWQNGTPEKPTVDQSVGKIIDLVPLPHHLWGKS